MRQAAGLWPPTLRKAKFHALGITGKGYVKVCARLILGTVLTAALAATPALAAEQQKLTASDGAAGDLFGQSVAISGDSLVVGNAGDDVGANVSQGSAYVFVRSGGVWTQQQKLTAGDGAASDVFGDSVAISGDTLVVGARLADVGANGEQGAAYVFVRNGGVWTQQQKLTADDGAAGDLFGLSVAITGDTVVVGAPADDGSQGAAYVFVRNGDVWTEQQKLTASDRAVNIFGHAVAISGDTVVVGALFDAVGANSDQGSAYVFVRRGGVWTEQQKLTAADGAADDLFSRSVAISGDSLVVSLNGDQVGARADQGFAYVFVRRGVVWTQQQKLIASDGAAGDQFGQSVAISGDTLVVGAHLADVGANGNQGSAYIFVRSGGVWTEQQKLTAGDGAAGDAFGDSVAISGDTLVVGTPGADVGANVLQGSAYVFSGATAQLLDVTADLETIVDTNPGAPLVPKVEDALAKVQRALAQLDQAAPDRKGALDDLKGAVNDLEAAVKDGLDAAEGTDLMDQIADAARLLAQTAIAGAEARAGDARKIAEAVQALLDGDALRAAGQFKAAVDDYKRALERAEGA